MAGEKTEQPTDKKLRKAREKGQVAKSTDLVQAALFLGSAAVLWSSGGNLGAVLMRMIRDVTSPDMLDGEISQARLFSVIGTWWMDALSALMPLLFCVVCLSIAVNFLQVRALFSMESLKPELSKLNPAEGFKRIFMKPRTYLDLVKNLLKISVVGCITWLAIDDLRRDILLSGSLSVENIGRLAVGNVYRLLTQTGVAFLVIGAADLVLQKQLYMKEQMMTKEEVKREYKEDEGDPHTKHRRQSMHHEILHEAEVSNVPTADVVIVNPTHLAVAVKYSQDSMNAPRVIAKGRNLHAERIREIARESKIPIARNVPLARRLIQVETGNEIPEDLYESVAEVLLWVYELNAERNR